MRWNGFASSMLVVLRLARASILVALVLAGCSDPVAPAAKPTTGDRADARRLIVLSPALAIICQDLGLEDQIVGRHDYDIALADSIAKVGDHLNLDYEAILRQRPTHIIAEAGLTQREPTLKRLASDRGFVVVEYPMLSLDDIARAADDLYLDLVAGGYPEPEATGGVMEFSDPSKRFDITLPSAKLARAFSRDEEGFDSVGRILLLGSSDPPGAVGPGSFHHQLLERMGGACAIATGAAWQELDAESIVRLAPDAIVLFAPGRKNDDPSKALGFVAKLDTPARSAGRIGVITHPHALLPGTSLANIADDLRSMLAAWRDEAKAPLHSGP